MVNQARCAEFCFLVVNFAIPLGWARRDIRQALLYINLAFIEEISAGCTNLESLAEILHLGP